MLDEYPTEARADLQRFYGLNLDGMGKAYTPEHAAACVACLPASSALFARLYPDYSILLSDLPVKAIADALAGVSDEPEEYEFEAMSIEDFKRRMAEFENEGVSG